MRGVVNPVGMNWNRGYNPLRVSKTPHRPDWNCVGIDWDDWDVCHALCVTKTLLFQSFQNIPILFQSAENTENQLQISTTAYSKSIQHRTPAHARVTLKGWMA